MRSGTEMTKGEIDSLIRRLKAITEMPELSVYGEATILQVITVLEQHPTVERGNA